MNILIVGAGVIGTIYGWVFSQAGHSVSHFVRAGRTDRCKKGSPLDILDNRKGYPKRFLGLYPVHAIEAPSGKPDFDLVILPVKPYQVEEALRAVLPFTGEAILLLLTQNWRGTESIDKLLPDGSYLYGDAQAGGTFRDGVLVGSLFSEIFLGPVNTGREADVRAVCALFSRAGIKPVRPENILHFIWIQYAVNAGLWPAVVRKGSIEALLKDRRLGELSIRAAGECLQVVAARGIDLGKYPQTGLFRHASSPIGAWIGGMAMTALFRFNESVRRSSAHALADPREIREAYFDLLNMAKELHVPTPVLAQFEEDIRAFAKQDDAGRDAAFRI